jgi:hypothetical protein
MRERVLGIDLELNRFPQLRCFYFRLGAGNWLDRRRIGGRSDAGIGVPDT